MATLLIYSVLLRYAIARPTSPSSVTSLRADNSTSVYATTSDNPSFDTNYRSTVEIVWSCLTVVVASSWLCVHPNVTGHKTTMSQRLRERLVLFVIAIFSPEIMAVFAYYQWRGSRKLYEAFKERAEGLGIRLLLDSGEFTLGGKGKRNDSDGQADDASAPNRVDPAGIAQCSTPGEAETLLIEAARGDTSRWSAVHRFWKELWSSFKAIPCAISSFATDPKQATWSYTHAHFVQMGGIAFCDDEGNVGFKCPKQWTDEDIKTFFAMNLREGAISDRSKAGALAKTLVVVQVLWFLVQAIARKAQGLPIALLEVSSLAFIAFNFAMYGFWWSKPLDVEFPVEIPGTPGKKHTISEAAPYLVSNLLMGHIDAIPIGSWIYSAKRRWYPRLYAFGQQAEVLDDSGHLNEGFDYALGLTIALTSSLFGAFHTIGWDLPAPSQVELALWRVSCLVLTLYPIVLLVLAVLLYFIDTCTTPRFFVNYRYSSYPITDVIVMLPSFLCSIAYVGARLAIISLPFLELRDLPSLVHETISWSQILSL